MNIDPSKLSVGALKIYGYVYSVMTYCFMLSTGRLNKAAYAAYKEYQAENAHKSQLADVETWEYGYAALSDTDLALVMYHTKLVDDLIAAHRAA